METVNKSLLSTYIKKCVDQSVVLKTWVLHRGGTYPRYTDSECQRCTGRTLSYTNIHRPWVDTLILSHLFPRSTIVPKFRKDIA